MPITIGTPTGNRPLTDPKVGDPGGVRRDVQKVWVGTPSGNKLVYQRAVPVDLAAAAAAWNQINLTWNNAGAGITYELKRGSSVIYSGTGLSKADTGLAANTTYSYTLTARSGSVVLSSDTASAKTPARPQTQKTWTGSRTSYASWTGGCANRGTAELYSGYYSSTQGNQRSHANFTIPAEIRNCVRIDQVWISAWNLHSFNGSGRTVQLAVNHGATAGASCGSTGTAVGLSAAKPGWVGGAEWVEVGGYVCPGRTTIKEEFRVNGAQGFTFNQGPDNNQAYYGYCRNDVRIRIVYTVWA